MTALNVFVAGKPAPQGSKRGMQHRATGKVILVESSKAVKPWREDVRAALLDEHGQPKVRIEGAVVVKFVFVMPRPVSTPKKRTPPAMRKPDIDKLVRAVLDAITSAGVIEDDARVVGLSAHKRLADIGEPTGCTIIVRSNDMAGWLAVAPPDTLPEVTRNG